MSLQHRKERLALTPKLCDAAFMHIPWEKHKLALWETRHWCERYLTHETLDLAAEPEVEVIYMDGHPFVTYEVPLKHCLRSPELRPEGYPDDWAYIELNPQEIEALIQKRSRLLQATGEPAAKGRIVCAGEHWDTHMGEGVPASKGLIDDIYLPPWDTWFAYLPGEQPFDGVLLCWIPDVLVDQVQAAIDVGATEPLIWLDNVEDLKGRGVSAVQKKLIEQAHRTFQGSL